MEIKEMNIDEIEARQAEILEEIKDEKADLEAINSEMDEINERKLELKTIAEAEVEERKQALEEGEIVKEFEEETEIRKMDVKEIRNSAEYIEAFANYIKTGDDTECRALLSENVNNGTVPVPTYIEGRVRTAWEKSGLIDLANKTYVKGNLKIGFEISADGAVIHEEGGQAITPENLTLGIVTLVPQSIKKLIQISDEALDLAGQEFLDYLYDELAYQIAKKIEGHIITTIISAPTTATATSPAVAELNTPSDVDSVIKALGLLSPEASNPVVVTTRSTWSAIKAAAIQANYAIDPFEGLDVYFASANDLESYYMIVGDFGYGAHLNFVNGADIDIKFDDKTDMASDLVNILGRQFVGIGIVAQNAFVKVKDEA